MPLKERHAGVERGELEIKIKSMPRGEGEFGCNSDASEERVTI